MDTSKRLPPERENSFPKLFSEGYGVTSEYDFLYNCIAWAAGDEHTEEKWDPTGIGGGYFWPEGLERNLKVTTFIKLYEMTGGYTPCERNDSTLEIGVDKIALYVDRVGYVSHAARQREDGTWTSKLGDWEDIGHKTLDGLCGDTAYGKVAKILRRNRTP